MTAHPNAEQVRLEHEQVVQRLGIDPSRA